MYPACSFSADTLVATEGGQKPISWLMTGDYVLAYNEITGEVSYYPIVGVWSHQDPVVVYLTIDGEIIETTPEHPFYTVDGEWIPAGELSVGDWVIADGKVGQVEAIEFGYEPQWMYNLTVDTAHTFFVGEGRWLVHNNCFPPTRANGYLGPPDGYKNVPRIGDRYRYLREGVPFGGTDKPGKYIYVIDKNGNILVSSRGSLKHPDLIGGENVYGAGQITVASNGKVTVDAISGHYILPEALKLNSPGRKFKGYMQKLLTDKYGIDKSQITFTGTMQ